MLFTALCINGVSSINIRHILSAKLMTIDSECTRCSLEGKKTHSVRCVLWINELPDQNDEGKRHF